MSVITKVSDPSMFEGEDGNPEVFWCASCDCEKVHSNKPQSGSFYLVSGHVWHGNVKFGLKGLGDYHVVVFAVCSGCEAEGEAR